MLFLLFGSSGSGKTAAIDGLRGRSESLAVHDFDEIGVPSEADTAWRHRANEAWIRRALEYQATGVDVFLAGQTPFGELLAAPSSPLLDAISACLLDCDDETRLARLAARGAGDARDHLAWAEWMRGHAADPGYRPEVVRHADTEAEMHWERWKAWAAGDPRWRVISLDATELSPSEVADALEAWIEAERALTRAGVHPLAHWAGAAGRL